MTPPASTEPKYLISEKQMRQIQNDCAYPCRVDCVGCDHSRDWGCEISANGIIDEIVARGPVQQAPAAHYCTHLKWLTQIEGDGDYRCELGNKTSCEWCEGKSRCGDYQSVNDAALIAQEREKWERERAEEHRTYESCHKHFACPDGEECWYSSADYYWDCGEGATRLSKAMAQAREDVLDELAQMYANVPEQFLEGTYRLHSEWKEKIESLRHGQKQEREKR